MQIIYPLYSFNIYHMCKYNIPQYENFIHPSKNKWVNFESELPNDFKKLLDLLKNLSS